MFCERDTMVDLGLNRNLEVNLDETNDLNVVDGRRELEQSIAITIYRFMNSELGSLDRDEITSRIERKANRVISANRYVDQVLDVDVFWSEENPNTVKLNVIYGSDELSEMEFNL